MTSSSDELESSLLSCGLPISLESDDNDEPKLPTVDLSRTEMAPIIEEYGQSFIIYVHGRKIGYHNLKTRLARLLMCLFGPYQLIDLGLGFFLLKISHPLDHTLVLSKYPLSIPRYCVTLLPWSPNFRPLETIITQVDVWVRLPELPIEFYDFLSRIAKAISGRTGLKIDPITENRKMCKFARFCVKVDITRPLPSLIKIGEKLQPVQYEGLDILCSQYNSAAVNASRASTSNEFVDSTGYRKPADTSKLVMSMTTGNSSSSDDGSWPQVCPFKHLHHYQRESSGPQRHPHVQNQNIATGIERDHQLIDQPKPRASVIPESNISLMQRVQNPVHGEGTSLSPIDEGTPIQHHKNIPPSMTKSLKPAEAPISPLDRHLKPKGQPAEFSNIAASSNTSPQGSTQHLSHQPTETMVKKAFHAENETASPRPSPNIQLYSTGTHKAMVHKDISNTLVREFNTEIRPTRYTIKPEVKTLHIGASRNGERRSFLPTLKNPHETVSQSHLQKLLCWKYNRVDNVTLIQTMKYLRQHENPSIVLLFGVRSSGNDAVQAIEEIGFSGSYRIDPQGILDGVWLLWNKEDVTIEVNSSISHQIDATVVHFLSHLSN
ncbi:hypothetical protein FCV25MIE_17976 [Fagus crenata]